MNDRLSAEALLLMAMPAGVEKYAVRDRASWLKMREQDVTASAAGALFGVHEYMTPYGLWMLKAGRIQEDPEETPPMRRGRLLEPVAIRMLAEENPTWKVSTGRHYFREPASRIGATPDAFAIDPARPGFGIVQIKSVEQSIFRRKWRGEDGSITPPIWIAIQAAVERALTGASWAAVAPMVIGHGVELPLIEIPETPGLIESLRERVSDFWWRVEANHPFDPDYGRDGDLIARLYSADDGSTVDLSGWNEGPALADEDGRLAGEIKERAERRKAIKAEILDKIGPAAVATMNGAVFATAKTVRRKSYTVAESQYRDLRIKRSA